MSNLLLSKAAESIPLPVYRTLIKREVLGLYYHVVADDDLPHIKHLYAYKAPARFENDLLYLKKHFNLINYNELAEHRLNFRRLKPNSLILTFDDGLSECYSIVRPLLLKHGIPCVFFVTTDYIDNLAMAPDLKSSLCLNRILSLDKQSIAVVIKLVNTTFEIDLVNTEELTQWVRTIPTNDHLKVDKLCHLLEVDGESYLRVHHPYLTCDEIKQLDADGFTIGAHSTRHQKFSLLKNSEIENDIVKSCKVVQSITGKTQIPFAFPFNMEGISRELLVKIREVHSHIGLYFGGNGICKDHRYVISRMCGDSPKFEKANRSNLLFFIKKAYMEEFSRKLRVKDNPDLLRLTI